MLARRGGGGGEGERGGGEEGGGGGEEKREGGGGERGGRGESEMEFCPMLKDGTTWASASSMFPEAGFPSSVPLMMSIGAEDSAAVRSVRRVPVTMTSVSALARSDSWSVESGGLS